MSIRLPSSLSETQEGAFKKSEIAGRYLTPSEMFEDAQDDSEPRKDQIPPPLFHPRERFPLFGGERGEAAGHPFEVFDSEDQIVDPAPVVLRHFELQGGQGGHGAGGSDQGAPGGHPFPSGDGKIRLKTFKDLANSNRLLIETRDLLAETDDAEGIAALEYRFAATGKDEFGAPAADVENQTVVWTRRQGRKNTSSAEGGFFNAVDDF